MELFSGTVKRNLVTPHRGYLGLFMPLSNRRQTGSSAVAEIKVKQAQEIIQDAEIIEILELVGSHEEPIVSKKHIGLTRPFSLAIEIAGIFIDTGEEYYKT